MSKYIDGQSFDLDNFSFKIGEFVEFIECHFSGIDFSVHNFSHFKFLDCGFSNCNFNNVSMKSAQMRSPAFNHSKLMGINWAESESLVSPSFNDCVLDYSVFQAMSLKGAKFTNSKLVEVDFHEAILEKADFGGSSLGGTNFSGADLRQSDFRGATQYTINVNETKVAKAKFSMPEAMSLLASLNVVID